MVPDLDDGVVVVLAAGGAVEHGHNRSGLGVADDGRPGSNVANFLRR
jgi:hypothetical protein